MELEEMKAQWDTMSQRVDTLELINKKRIMEITQMKYKNKFNKLKAYERGGSVICYLIGFYVLFNIDELNTWYLLLCGILTMSFLFILPILSLKALNNMSKISLSQYSYKETLQRFESARKQTLLLQRSGIVLSVLMMFVCIPVADMLLNHQNFFQQELKGSFWGAIAFGILFTLFFSRWGYNCYRRITASAGSILEDLEE